MANNLFRQQSVEHQKAKLYGDVILRQPPSVLIIIIFILVIVSSLITLLVKGSYARRESVVGYIVPDKGLVKIYAPLAGVLATSYILEGQTVGKGEILFSISTTKNNGKGSDRDALLLKEIEQLKKQHRDKINQEKRIFKAKFDSINQLISGLNLECEQLEKSIALKKQQLSNTSKNLLKLSRLYKLGHISEKVLDKSEQNNLNTEVLLQSLIGDKVKLLNKIVEYQQQQQLMPLEWQSRLSDLKKVLSDFEQKIVEISGRRNYIIKAPISGRLTALQVFEGQTIKTISPLIAILPEGSTLDVDLFVPTRAAGFIAKGQKVLLRYDAFPYQHYGLHKGIVESITHTILSPSELPLPIVLLEPVYRVRVNVNEQVVRAYAKEFPLQAGMLLNADIILDNRTLAEWLFEPLYGITGRL
jgi:membrane fusion protein